MLGRDVEPRGVFLQTQSLYLANEDGIIVLLEMLPGHLRKFIN